MCTLPQAVRAGVSEQVPCEDVAPRTQARAKRTWLLKTRCGQLYSEAGGHTPSWQKETDVLGTWVRPLGL